MSKKIKILLTCFVIILLLGIISCDKGQRIKENNIAEKEDSSFGLRTDSEIFAIDLRIPEETRRLREELGEEGYEKWKREEAMRLQEELRRHEEELRRQREKS